MTGKEYMQGRIQRTVLKTLQDNGFEATPDNARISLIQYVDSEKSIKIILRSPEMLEYFNETGLRGALVYFDFKEGIDENEEYKTYTPDSGAILRYASDKCLLKMRNIVMGICRKINRATLLERFTLRRGLTIAQLRKIYPDIPKPKEKIKPDIPEGKDIQGHPDVIDKVTKCVRIKIKDRPNHFTHRLQYRMVTVGGITKDKKYFTTNSPLSIGVAHSSELTFLNKEDAQEFIDNNKEFFSQFDPNDIEFGRSQTYSLCKIPVFGSDKAYATKDYIDWRIHNNKPMPIK